MKIRRREAVTTVADVEREVAERVERGPVSPEQRFAEGRMFNNFRNRMLRQSDRFEPGEPDENGKRYQPHRSRSRYSPDPARHKPAWKTDPNRVLGEGPP